MVVFHTCSLRIRALNCDGETFPSFEVTWRVNDLMKDLARKRNSLGIVSPDECKNVSDQILWEVEDIEHSLLDHVYASLQT
jgi:hypothetical protein